MKRQTINMILLAVAFFGITGILVYQSIDDRRAAARRNAPVTSPSADATADTNPTPTPTPTATTAVVTDNQQIHDRFNAVYEQAAKMKPKEGTNLLWGETFQLKQWLFLCKPGTPNDKQHLYIAPVMKKGCFMAFTDSIHAKEYAESKHLLTAKGEAQLLSMKPQEAMVFLRTVPAKQAFGITINYGTDGYLTSLFNLQSLYAYCKSQNPDIGK